MSRAAGFIAIALVACQSDLPVPIKCHDIPAGGCPRRGDVCEDPACTAVYVCKADGTWRLDRECPPKPPLDASVDAPSDASVADAGAIKDVDVDVPGASGGPGCESLVAPDCSLATAAACTQSCCGCEDVFVCEGGGWNLYGRCDNGNVIRE